jgi:hypothetical protein
MWVIGFPLSLSFLIIYRLLGQSMMEWVGYARGTGNMIAATKTLFWIVKKKTALLARCK